ncbi:hypothetical protein GWK47_009012 [Chionoecetes opilio]|uniref:Uncharacterized protein n=1 Tax=Chionoecetes opilio TaxID=41210 RepID=A0A8J4Y8D4_CHIOP|nr:hypothetical protein GWK47_009012 [Chionoecetes opilio]
MSSLPPPPLSPKGAMCTTAMFEQVKISDGTYVSRNKPRHYVAAALVFAVLGVVQLVIASTRNCSASASHATVNDTYSWTSCHYIRIILLIIGSKCVICIVGYLIMARHVHNQIKEALMRKAAAQDPYDFVPYSPPEAATLLPLEAAAAPLEQVCG